MQNLCGTKGGAKVRGIILEQISRTEHLFISDLRGACQNSAVVASLKKVNWQSYNFDECNYALSYILGRKIALETYEEMAHFVGGL